MKVRNIKNIILWVLLLAFFPVVFSFVAQGKNSIVCSQVNVEVKDSISYQFVTSEQIRSIILNKYPRLLGASVEDINCEEIETFLRKHEAINNCEAYYTVGGQLNVFVGQKKPVLRVFSGYDSYYLDEEGNKMSLFDQYTSHTLILSGHVNKLDSLNEVLNFAKYITENLFWNAQIEQIYVESNGEFSLAPRVGDQIIYLGSLNDYSVKMKHLYALYTGGLHPREWNNYKEINLKYEGQIICTKQ